MKNLIRLAVIVLAVGVVGDVASAPPAGASGYEPDLLDVKFREEARVRLRDGHPAAASPHAAVDADLQGIVRAFAEGIWTRTHSVDEPVLDRLRAAGQANTAKHLPDLNNYLRLRLPRGLSAARAKEILERYESVEAAYLVPKPAPPPAAPDYSAGPALPYQDYLNAAPVGIDARNAWTRGFSGNGVKVCDVEYAINRSHLDLPVITPLGNLAIDYFEDDHGTGVMGIVSSKNDGSGTKGIAYNAQGYFAGALTSLGYNAARGVMECGAALSAGDVVLLEQQVEGPLGYPNYVPSEWSKPVYDAIVTLVANGIVVVEASGNGGQDLDDPIYATGNDGHWPFLLENDSGAIMVTGAQSPHAATPRSYHPWSNYGATVDLQGWGDSIVTAGYGDLYAVEGPNSYYRSAFGGSSGASPMVVGAVALLQEAHKANYGAPAPPSTIKHLLVSTGTPQAGSRHLGPLPNLQAAFDALGRVIFVDDTAVGLTNGMSWATAYHELQDALYQATPGTRILVAEGYYWPDWIPGTGITGDRAASFQLRNGVTLIGGYPNGGGARDVVAHKSILSGDINQWLQDLDNSFHVVTAGAAIDDSAVLDGFFVWSGRADGAYPNDRGGGMLVAGGSPVVRNTWVQWNRGFVAGGIYNEAGSPSFQDVMIAFNEAISGGGGGMWNQGGGPRLTGVTFYQNNAPGEGGGLFSQGGTPHIEGGAFLENVGTRGGGISHWPGGSLVLDSTLFRGNQTSADIGGAIMNWLGTLRLNNVTMTGNAAPIGGGIYQFDPDTVTIRNSIVWGNAGGNVAGPLATVTNSIIQGGYPGTGVLNADPQFRDAADLRLRPASPAIDAGDPETCAATDQRGVYREDTCDIGAYEYLGNPGIFWTNGEVDLLHAGESFNTWSWDDRHSADDFVVPAGTACAISSLRGVLQDATKTPEATALLYRDNAGDALIPVTGWFAYATCAHDPTLACSDAADCPTGAPCDLTCLGSGNSCSNGQCVSACKLPGRSLGYRQNGRLWEPRFDTPGLRLGPGTYWLSIYGEVEPGSAGISYSVSAGDGTIRGSSYILSTTGFWNWTDGGPYYGDVPRDLALDVDAVCGPDLDGDLVPAGTDCDDTDPNRYPGNFEWCDGIDNDCDGIADTGAPPTGSRTLFVSRTQLSWNAVAGDAAYDIVRGDISSLRSTGGDFATGSCDENDVAGTTYEIPSATPHGLGLWYLVRAESVCGHGSYNETVPSQVQSRDAEITAGGNACP